MTATMLRLHGYAVSNYYNTAYAALIEKGCAFEVVRTRASREAALLAASPLGKIPYLETPHGTLSETLPILEYLDETADGPRLYPAAGFARARVRQTLNILQLYLDAPLRRLYPGVFMGGINTPDTVDTVAAQLPLTLDALRRLFVFEPFLMGVELGVTDLFALYLFDVGDRVTRRVYGWSLLERIEGAGDWSARMLARDSTRRVAAGFASEFPRYLVERKARYQPADGGGLFAVSTAAAA